MLTVDVATAEIRAALERISGLTLERITEVRGEYAALFEVRPSPTSAKYFATGWFSSLADLLSSVLDTLEHIGGGELDVNIFSAQMFEYLSAEMLPADRPISLTVTGVAEETVTGPRGEDVKVILSFGERPKKLILNKTNARLLAKFLTPETDNWLGASITFGVEQIKVGKNIVPSIRVKSAKRGRPPVDQGDSGPTGSHAGAPQVSNNN